MPIKDLASNLRPVLAMNANITTNTTTAGSIIDTANFDAGVMFDVMCPVYTDGTYTAALYHSDDSGMSGEVVVPTENLIESLPVLTAANVAGAVIQKVGIFGTLRYVRLKIVSTSVTSGARITSTVTMKGDILPVSTS